MVGWSGKVVVVKRQLLIEQTKEVETLVLNALGQLEEQRGSIKAEGIER